MKGKWITVVLSLALAAGLFGVLPAERALAATCTSTATGNWSAAGTWSCSQVPAAGDDVVIASGHTVTVDATTNSLASLTVNGTLRFDSSGTAKTMTVAGNVTVNSGGTLDVATGGTATTHALLIGGNLTNNGTFDALPAAGRIINVTFNGSSNQSSSGNGATNRFNLITINNTGGSGSNIVDVTSSNFTVSAGYLTLTSGIFKVSGNFTLANTFFGTASYSIPATAGLWLNNGNVTVTGQNGTPTLNGLLRITSGTYNVGTSSGNSLQYATGAVVTIEGGILTIAGRFCGTSTAQTVAFTMSGGTMTVAAVGQGSTATGSFDIPATGSTFTMSAGTIVLQNRSTTTGTVLDYRNVAGTVSITGGTVQFGNAATSGSPSFEVGVSAGPASVFPNLIVNATGTPLVNLNTGVVVNGNVTLGSGTTVSANAHSISLTGAWTNNGTFTAGTGAVTFNGPSAQTISGSPATAFNNLTIAGLGSSAASNSVVVLPSANIPTAAGTVTNNGTLKQTLTPGGSTDFVKISNGSSGFSYYGVGTTNGSNLGSTTVSVSGNQPPCWAWGNTQATVKRCFEITPANAASPQVTFYYQFNELNGLTPANLFVWRDAGGGVWTKIVPDTRSACTSGIACSVTVNSLSLSAGANRYVLSSANPTAITLAEFYAQQVNDHVRVTWQTASELNNRGFNLYRGASPAGWDRQLNTALIPSQGQGSPSGFTYTWEDRADLAPGTTYYYWLQDVDLSGAMTMHGPVSVDFTVPTAVTLSGVSASPGLDTLRYSTHAAGAAALPWLWVVAAATGAALGVRRMRR